MYFAKDEIIELSDTKKYLVLDTVLIDDTAYYKVKEIDENESQIIGENKYITAINNEGNLYINDELSQEEIAKLDELFLN